MPETIGQETRQAMRAARRPSGNGSRVTLTIDQLLQVAKKLSDPAFFQYHGRNIFAEVQPLRDAYSQVAAVYACIEARARPLAGCPLKTYTRNADDELEEAENNPFDELINRPNPLWSRYQLLHAWETSVCRYGEAFILLDRERENAIPAALWILQPDYMEPEKDGKGLPIGWNYRAQAGMIRYQPFQILHDKLPNPDNPVRGKSPLEAAELDIKQEWDVARWNRSFLENNCDPGGRYELSGGGTLSQEQVRGILKQHRDKHTGPSRVGEAMIDMGGLRWNRLEIPHKDMSFEQQREFNLRAIKMVLGVPSVALGFEEEIPYAGAKAQMRMFWTNTLIPRMRMIEDIFWSALTEKIERGRYELRFDLTGVEALRDDLQEKATVIPTLFNVGVPVSEINRRLDLGLEEFEGWEDSHLPAAYLMGGPAESVDGAPAKGGADFRGAVKEAVEFEDFTTEEKTEAREWDHKVLRPNEKKFHGKVRSYIFDRRNACLEAFARLTGWDGQKAEGKAGVPFDPNAISPKTDELKKKLQEMLEPIYRTALLNGAQHGANLIGTEAQVTAIRGALARFMREQCLDKITRIEDTIREELRASLDEGIEKGETLYQLAGRVKDIHHHAQGRSMTIARTEVGRAANHGQSEEFKEAGFVESTRWNAAMDGATREEHRLLHRQVAPLGQTFKLRTGGDSGLLYPCDPAGSAKMIINCRCIARPVMKKE